MGVPDCDSSTTRVEPGGSLVHVSAGLELEALWLTWPPVVPHLLPGAQLPLQLEMHLQVGQALTTARVVFSGESRTEGEHGFKRLK